MGTVCLRLRNLTTSRMMMQSELTLSLPTSAHQGARSTREPTLLGHPVPSCVQFVLAAKLLVLLGLPLPRPNSDHHLSSQALCVALRSTGFSFAALCSASLLTKSPAVSFQRPPTSTASTSSSVREQASTSWYFTLFSRSATLKVAPSYLAVPGWGAPFAFKGDFIMASQHKARPR